MKLRAELAHSEHEVTLNFSDEGVEARVDDRVYDLEVRELATGDYLFLQGTKVFRCRIDGATSTQNAFNVSLRGRDYEITLVDPKRLRSAHVAGAHEHGSAEIVSPMPGRVVRVLVAEGEKVEAGQGIIVVEAMKMQNELKTPKAGTVVSVNADAGSTVSAGDVLAVID